MIKADTNLDKNLQDIALTFGDGFHFMQLREALSVIQARLDDPKITNLQTEAALMKMVGQFADMCRVIRQK
jgi:hypothetical protein